MVILACLVSVALFFLLSSNIYGYYEGESLEYSILEEVGGNSTIIHWNMTIVRVGMNDIDISSTYTDENGSVLSNGVTTGPKSGPRIFNVYVDPFKVYPATVGSDVITTIWGNFSCGRMSHKWMDGGVERQVDEWMHHGIVMRMVVTSSESTVTYEVLSASSSIHP